jgi:hypothetical protein
VIKYAKMLLLVVRMKTFYWHKVTMDFSRVCVNLK